MWYPLPPQDFVYTAKTTWIKCSVALWLWLDVPGLTAPVVAALIFLVLVIQLQRHLELCLRVPLAVTRRVMVWMEAVLLINATLILVAHAALSLTMLAVQLTRVMFNAHWYPYAFGHLLILVVISQSVHVHNPDVVASKTTPHVRLSWPRWRHLPHSLVNGLLIQPIRVRLDLSPFRVLVVMVKQVISKKPTVWTCGILTVTQLRSVLTALNPWLQDPL